MRKFEIYGVSALLGLALTFGVTACSSSDPANSIDNPTVPEVKVINTITGMVSDRAGDPIKGAVVTMGTKTCTTGEDGFYDFTDVAAGTGSISVTATGKISDTKEVNVPDTKEGSNTVVNFTLANEGKKLEKQADGTSKAETTTETLKGNDAAEIPVEVVAPEDVFDEEDQDAEITVTPVYTDDIEEETTKAITRAGDELFLGGTTLACSKAGAKLKKSLTLTYTIDPSVVMIMKVMKFKNGAWTEVTDKKAVDLNTGKVVIMVDEFATYGLFCNGSMSATDGSEAISFTKNTWDNTEGTAAITVDKAEYSYKVGCDVQAQKDKVLAYLVEMIVRATGAGLSTKTGSYPLSVSLPAGTGLKISGTQSFANITAKMGTKSITAKHYGDVTISTYAWAVNREHTGGGSK